MRSRRWRGSSTRREVDQEYGAPGDRVNFADGYPLLLTTAGSLAELGHWLAADGHPPVPVNRFRPNVVVGGTRPWAEDRWRRIRIGTVTFRVVKPCGRCLVTTIDQATAERGRQPLAMLGRRRRIGQQLVFGQNMIPDAPGIIRAGDQVHVLEQSPQLSGRRHLAYFLITIGGPGPRSAGWAGCAAAPGFRGQRKSACASGPSTRHWCATRLRRAVNPPSLYRPSGPDGEGGIGVLLCCPRNCC
jgi:hypothetical protein